MAPQSRSSRECHLKDRRDNQIKSALIKCRKKRSDNIVILREATISRWSTSLWQASTVDAALSAWPLRLRAVDCANGIKAHLPSPFAANYGTLWRKRAAGGFVKRQRETRTDGFAKESAVPQNTAHSIGPTPHAAIRVNEIEKKK